ncbi:hypothetical protein [Staphylococcus sp. 47.1]|uniref:hypothetical protein n=1 Tax=Staphylococcus sp. 47.1 TaxID=1929484 RepID=UPI0009472D75|nr:hypothetical protein [Staphylococcus sp. 47.1]OLF32230.1 hypothetical protein BSZ11_06780 [Staphylococcus sp. 47.1]
MDKEILNYLDKVGQYLQGAGEKGFETYVHGVFVSSLVKTIIGITLIVIAVFLIKLAINYWDNIVSEDMEIYVIAIPIMFVIGALTLGSNITGIFAPDYVAIKEIAENIGGKR